VESIVTARRALMGVAMEHLGDEERLVALAKVAEIANRFDEMAKYMKERVDMGGALGSEERDLLSVAYKTSMDERRHALRVVRAIAEEKTRAGRVNESSMVESYSSKVEAELLSICETVSLMLSSKLVPYATEGEPMVFYLKMKADYNRYMAEFESGTHKIKAVDAAAQDYIKASGEAEKHLLNSHPVRLSLALNYSIFQHEVLEDHKAAIETARKAREAAAIEVLRMPVETQREAAHSLNLLQENINLWVAEGEGREAASLQSSTAVHCHTEHKRIATPLESASRLATPLEGATRS